MSEAIAPPVVTHPVLSEFNPFHPAQCHNPYDMYAHARQEIPIFFSPILNSWVVTRHKDICHILRDPARFSSKPTLSPIERLSPQAQEILAEGFAVVPHLVDNDPPDHTRLRRLCNKAFTPQLIRKMEASIRELANELIDQFVQDGQGDLIAQFAHPLPRMVIADIVGVPREDGEKFGQWTDDWATLTFVRDLPVEQQITCAQGAVAFQKYIAKMIASRRQDAREDLLTLLLQVQLDDIEENSLDEVEIVTLINAFLVAGHKTTTNFIGNALIQLLDNPDIYRALLEDPSLVHKVLEETLRRDTPTPGMFRQTAEDVVIDGIELPAGSRIYLLYGSANHDEAVFEEPLKFDIERSNLHEHLGFGHGIHYCIGAPVARMEGQIALETLLTRLPNLRYQPDRPPTYTPNLIFRILNHLHLAWDV